jgi:oxygen-independent coproporphyrinogen-3 oxidase
MGTQFSSIDLALLKKYDRPGPRYTSYPTAPLFSPTFTPKEYREALSDTNRPGSAPDLSLYFHFPFCDTLCYFCGCTMLVTRDRGRIEEYNRYLKREIDMLASLVADGRHVVQLHWGGGTPTHLSPEQIRDISSYIRDRFEIAPDSECSVELDPREMTRDHVAALAEAGFTRMSMGVQDFNERVQQSVNRVQPEAMTRQVLDWARELGFTSVNIDLIYGLPFQTVDTFRETIERILPFQADRIAVFNYAHVPWLKPHQKLILPENLPTPEQKLDILKMTIESLASSGYEYIGMDHFAKPTDELARAQKEKTLYRNFQGYSTRSGADLYGIGMSSIGHFGRVYAQNMKTLPEYYKALDASEFATHVGYTMTDDDVLRKHVIMRLMCDLELDLRAVERSFGIVFGEYFKGALDQLKPLEEDGLVHVSDDMISIVGAGRLLLRNIAMPFDAYLEGMTRNKPIFSRTV